ncbi:MAG: dTMP kinase [Gammaproteobacteria bacterium]|jgi:dTMP kinase|nr:dTMP kinase [Gammaproteobacteria bacterium]MBT4492307.1 dTMP kinase [Gammaproteobacteria bacterium]MBT7369390.1 dTMP kinase [Gammaproteobacteria bacterium]
MSGGKFITIEGVEGVGKSTNIALVESLIRNHGHEVLLTREPGGTATGERIRDILLDKEEQRMTAMTELLLMFAARAQHVEEIIKPALAKGFWVISDRFTDSSFAYQGGGRELGAGPVEQLENLVLSEFRPDLTLVLDVDVMTGLERATAETEADRFEMEHRDFFERVRAAFLARASLSRYRVIDAAGSIEMVQAEIGKVIEAFCRDS